jgi:putative FmdB family regulatory protein
MPFYEYECADCKFYLEVMQKISEPPLKKCPSCGRSRLKKLVSAPNFRLKGGGWYETDFKSDQEKKRNLAVEKEPEAKPAAEAKSEAKPVEAKPSEPKAPEAKPAEPKRKPTSRRITRTKSRPKPKAAARRRKRR